ncbi:MAG: hypothetical protein JWR88_1224, partial [Pseudonocardia sp.]|nr:hypothetical protein [Pseudonocardia sp.]
RADDALKAMMDGETAGKIVLSR